MTVRYADLLQPLRDRLAELPGLTAVTIGMPMRVLQTPLAFFFYAGGGDIQQGGVAGSTYEVTAGVLVPLTDTSNSEARIAPYVDALPALFSQQHRHRTANQIPATLGGLVNMVTVRRLRSGENDGVAVVNGVPFRAVFCDLVITCKGNRP